ncbi:LysR family transcriptional regulator [Saccharothrix sp. ST-888]|uniref:LysR family transcriptional regulator n=1 Tax=Saccharothrix sp. ST-888 TaxID=1427391 RepID=UPI000696C17D|nr:LysR family transcriptional regulator [Saccharothrix sp. ST-888]
MDIDVRTLRTFCEVIRTGSFTRAAQRLGYSQSSVTAQMRALEREVGEQLFQRLPSGVQLTPAGLTLRSYADQLLALVGELEEALRGPATTVPRLTVGVVPTLAYGEQLARIAHFGRLQLPGAQLALRVLGTTELQAALRNRELDCAVVLTGPAAGKEPARTSAAALAATATAPARPFGGPLAQAAAHPLAAPASAQASAPTSAPAADSVAGPVPQAVTGPVAARGHEPPAESRRTDAGHRTAVLAERAARVGHTDRRAAEDLVETPLRALDFAPVAGLPGHRRPAVRPGSAAVHQVLLTDPDCPSQRWLPEFLRLRSGESPDSLELGSVEGVLASAQSGLGCAMLPCGLTTARHGRTLLPLPGVPRMRWQISLLSARTPGLPEPHLQGLAETVRQALDTEAIRLPGGPA